MQVVDASVWVALCHAKDRHHEICRRWLEAVVVTGERLAAPSLLEVEVAAAVRRLTGDETLAQAATRTVDDGPMELIELTVERAHRAAELAAATGVRGADAVYLELAAHHDATLVTLDRQQLERGGTVARVRRPTAERGS